MKFKILLSNLFFWKQKKKTEESFSLYNIDTKLNEFLRCRNGFFIEVGANDGIRQSNTLFFEKYKGWKGLLIEPIPHLAEQCKINRPKCIVENCALVSDDYSDPRIEMHYCNLMSMVHGSFAAEDETEWINLGKKFLNENENDFIVSVPALTLNDVMEKHNIKHADFLSLDVEGYELDVLNGIDFKNKNIDFLLIEVHNRDKNLIEHVIREFYKPITVLSQNDRFSDILYGKKNLSI